MMAKLPWSQERDGSVVMGGVVVITRDTVSDSDIKDGRTIWERLDLIATAPELLAALNDATQALVNLRAEGESRYLPIVEAAESAIANALGRS